VKEREKGGKGRKREKKKGSGRLLLNVSRWISTKFVRDMISVMPWRGRPTKRGKEKKRRERGEGKKDPVQFKQVMMT